MIRRSLPNAIAIACVSAAWPSVAADSETSSGLVGTGLGMFCLAVAAALLLTLFIRVSANRLSKSFLDRTRTQRFKRILDSRSCHVLQDFILPGAFGGLTRIDHAVLTQSGILCIQSKHYQGTVIGEAKDPQWVVDDGTQRRNFLNPLIQSEGRAKALQKIVTDLPVVNLVVFTGDVTFTSDLDSKVIHIRDLAAYIEQFDAEQCAIDNRDNVWQMVKAAALTDDDSRKDFAAQLSFS